MPGTKSFLAQEFTRFFEAAWLELPAAAGKIVLGVGDRKELREAGWKAYDAWIRLANEVTNAVYSDPIIGEVTARMMESALRMRQVGGAMAAASLSNLWPSIGLPTHGEIVAVRDELLELRQELAAYAAGLPVPDDSAAADAHDAPEAVRKRAQLNEYLGSNSIGSGANSNSSAFGYLARLGKRHVAA